MNTECGQNQEEFFCPEAEVAACLASADRVIYPTALEILNRAKIDYNMAVSQYTDMPTRIMLARKYLDILKPCGSIFGVNVYIIRDVFAQRPQLALVLEHASYLTIDWLDLIHRLQVGESEPNFVAWANLVIQNKYDILEQMRSVTKEVKTSQFSKNSSKS